MKKKTILESANAVTAGMQFCRDNKLNLFQAHLFFEVKKDRSYKEIGCTNGFDFSQKQVGKQVELLIEKVNKRQPIGAIPVHSMMGVYLESKSFSF